MRNAAWIAFLFLPASLEPQQPPPLAQLFEDTKSLTSLLKSDIATLGFFAVSERNASTNAAMFHLSEVRIKALRTLADTLDAARPNGSHAQNGAVARIVPVINEFAASAEAAIARAKQSPPASEQYFKLNANLAEELSSVISAWVDYAKTKAELDQLAR